MGYLTVAQITSEGQLLAGRDDATTEAEGYLQRWLNAVAASWPWPQLQGESVGIALTAGTSAISFGAGASGGPSYKVLKILDNVWLYNSAKTMRSRVRIRHQLSSPIDRIQPSTNIGLPQTMRIFGDEDMFGRWDLSFEPIPDRDYLLTIPHSILPAQISSSSQTPWYPNDETMVKAVAFKVAEFYGHPLAQQFQADLAGLVANDRIRYGNTTGVNDTLPLSPDTFRVKDNQ